MRLCLVLTSPITCESYADEDVSKVDVTLCLGKHPKSETAFCVQVNLKRKADEAASMREAKQQWLMQFFLAQQKKMMQASASLSAPPVVSPQLPSNPMLPSNSSQRDFVLEPFNPFVGEMVSLLIHVFGI